MTSLPSTSSVLAVNELSLPNLACPDCRRSLTSEVTALFCNACNHYFPKLAGDIINLLPQCNKVGDEVIYRSPDYKAQFPFLPEIRRFFYTRKLARWSMSWGHKNTVRLLGKKVVGVSVDLGVGRGDHYAYVENGDDLIGVDYDAEALQEIKKSGIKAKLFQADLTRLPFSNKCFDSVRSTYAFEHLYYLEVCLEEIYRTLKDDGVLVASFPIVGAWMMDLLSRLGPQREFKKKYGLHWGNVLKVEHCNSSRRILEAVRRIFIIDKILWSPFPFFRHNLNMFVTLRARKNPLFLEKRV